MIVQTSDQLTNFIMDMHNERIVTVDTETNGLRPFHGNRVVGLAFYFPDSEHSYYLPTRHDMTHSDGYRNLTDNEMGFVIEAWNIRAATGLFVYFNAQFDIHMMCNDGFTDPGHIEDVMLAAHLLNENEALSNSSHHPLNPSYKKKRKGAYTLKRLAGKYLGEWATEGEEELEAIAKSLKLSAKSEIYKLPLAPVAKYAELDVLITWELRQFYMAPLHKWSLTKLYERRNKFVLHTLIRMERNGIQIDKDTLLVQQDERAPKAAALAAEVDAEAKKIGLNYDPLNMNSPVQLKAFMNLRGNKITSTNAITLAGLRDPMAQKILDYRVLNKANSTYYTPYLKAMTDDGVIHPHYNPSGTVTGRPTSYDPNFYQIPRSGNEKGYMVKELLVPRPGYTWVEIDYSQLEFRLGAHYADERVARRMFNQGVDTHQFTADSLGVDRPTGKTANFSFLYGMGAKTGAIRLGSTEAEAKKVIDGWHGLFPAFRVFASSMAQHARKRRGPNGDEPGEYQYIRLEDGRMRRYQEYWKYPNWSENSWSKEPPFYTAFNSFIQGTASGTVMEQSLLRCCLSMPDNDIFRPVLTVYDSNIFEVRTDYLGPVVNEVKQIMMDWDFNPRLEVDAKASIHNWMIAERI